METLISKSNAMWSKLKTPIVCSSYPITINPVSIRTNSTINCGSDKLSLDRKFVGHISYYITGA